MVSASQDAVSEVLAYVPGKISECVTIMRRSPAAAMVAKSRKGSIFSAFSLPPSASRVPFGT